MKVGDKVTIKENKYGFGGHYQDFTICKPGTVAYITEILGHGAQLAAYPECDPDEHSEQSLFFGFNEFELLSNSTFKVGDRVRLSMQGIRKWRADGWTDHESDNPIFVDGTVHEIVEEDESAYDWGFRFRVIWDNNNKNSYMEGDIEDAA